MGPKYLLLGACCLLALALASQRPVVVFARDVPTHNSTGHVPLTSNDNAGRGKQPSLLHRRQRVSVAVVARSTRVWSYCYILPLSQIIRRFGISVLIAFTIYLDIIYI